MYDLNRTHEYNDGVQAVGDGVFNTLFRDPWSLAVLKCSFQPTTYIIPNCWTYLT
jgi:hypothetical protein